MVKSNPNQRSRCFSRKCDLGKAEDAEHYEISVLKGAMFLVSIIIF